MVVTDQHEYLCEEERRLKEDRERSKYWKKFGPYVAERQWATGARDMLPEQPGPLIPRFSSEGRLFVSRTTSHVNSMLSFAHQREWRRMEQ